MEAPDIAHHQELKIVHIIVIIDNPELASNKTLFVFLRKTSAPYNLIFLRKSTQDGIGSYRPMPAEISSGRDKGGFKSDIAALLRVYRRRLCGPFCRRAHALYLYRAVRPGGPS